MRRKLTSKNKNKFTQRRLQAIKLGIPTNLMMTGRLKLVVDYYQYLRNALNANADEQKYMEVSFVEGFKEKQILSAIFQDLHRWRAKSQNAPSEELKCSLIQSLARLFPLINCTPELDIINLGTTLCDDIRHATGDYSLNRIAHPPYQRPCDSGCNEDEIPSAELSKIWEQFIRKAENYDEIRELLTSPIKPDV
ncbi:hypothetical protein [Vibrio gigantis]|uniref:Uncharacterized protein n=1 Tax=Vibrio gigantis TaxID=296199 RepID=A0A5M9NZY0_9VIBR|nr:hypothetical protein [Vibrio gigantis]KAA8677699.1 hypothetical protein F4W18_09085 [Vibrio gigantis]